MGRGDFYEILSMILPHGTVSFSRWDGEFSTGQAINLGRGTSTDRTDAGWEKGCVLERGWLYYGIMDGWEMLGIGKMVFFFS